ncbi:MAG: hypothetical protein DMF36_09830 [Verrucomicrobia bacterium]|nr:MAG: hypothetical protein DMF36_09830 [Verrucomicrobiota bacterium]
MSDKPSLFSELKRRHVDKVALVYAVVSWLLIELAWILLPTLDAPEWMLPAFVVLIALGFVITVFISWSFEMTPEGMKRTADVTPGEALPYWSKRKFARFVIGVAVIAVCLLAYQVLRSTGGHVVAKHRTDKIIIQGNPAGTQTVELLEESQRTGRESCLWRSFLPADECTAGIFRRAGSRVIESTEPQTAAPACRRGNH